MAKMKLFIVPPGDFATTAGDYVARRMFEFGDAVSFVLGTATGGTMEGLYSTLVARARRDSDLALCLRTAHYFGMDEYVGLEPDNPQSYEFFMRKHLLTPLGTPTRNLKLPSEKTVLASPLAEDGRSVYDQMIFDVGGIDLQLAGIGENGHLAFNEPGSMRTSWARRVELAPGTKEANARFFSNSSEVPCEAYTMGIQTILKAKSVVLCASGKKKARAVQRMIEGRPGSDCPASFLLDHGDVTVFLDWDAASDLHLRSGLYT